MFIEQNFTEFPFNDGAFTCAYFSLNDKYIFFSSTLHLGQDCPEIYKDPNPRKYIWPLRDYEIFRYENEEVVQLTNYPGYNAETTIHPNEEKVIFTWLDKLGGSTEWAGAGGWGGWAYRTSQRLWHNLH